MRQAGTAVKSRDAGEAWRWGGAQFSRLARRARSTVVRPVCPRARRACGDAGAAVTKHIEPK